MCKIFTQEIIAMLDEFNSKILSLGYKNEEDFFIDNQYKLSIKPIQLPHDYEIQWKNAYKYIMRKHHESTLES